MVKSAAKKSSPTRSAKARMLSSRISYQGPVFSVTTDEVEEAGRRPRPARCDTAFGFDRGSGGRRLAKAAEPRVLLERQYRHAAQSMMWELPAGRIDDGETALTAAKRELLEETGYTAPPVEEDSCTSTSAQAFSTKP